MSSEVGRLNTEPCHQVKEEGWCSYELLARQHTDYQVATGKKEQDKLPKSGPLRQLLTQYLNLYRYNFIIRQPIHACEPSTSNLTLSEPYTWNSTRHRGCSRSVPSH